MKNIKVFTFLILILTLISSALCQETNKSKIFTRYPNELKGFELMKSSKLKTLVPGISTENDVIRIFGKDCKNKHERLSVCELDKNWYVSFGYDGETNSGILWDIQFYPHKRTPFSKIRFSKAFKKYGMGIVHLPIEVTKFISYSDKFGLSYVIIDEKGDWEFKKGDLFYIEYSFLKIEKRREN